MTKTKIDPRAQGRALSLQAQHLQALVGAIEPRLAAAEAEKAVVAAERALADARLEPVAPVAALESRNLELLRVQLIELRGEAARLEGVPR